MYLHRVRGGGKPAIKRGYDARFKVTPTYRAELPDMMAATVAVAGAPVPIQQVGVSNFRLPLKFRTKRGALVTLASSVTTAPRFDRNLSGNRKLETPTCWMGTGAPATASVAAIISGNSAR